MGSSGILYPKVTAFLCFFWAWSRWVSKKTNELMLFLLAESNSSCTLVLKSCNVFLLSE